MLNRMQELDMAAHITIPRIPVDPLEASILLRDTARDLAARGRFAVAGSSLGGFYATWIAEQHDCRAALINPAVRPWNILQSCLGENTNYHTFEKWTFTQAHIDALKKLDCGITRPERYLVLLQTGDETLDYRDAVDRYRDCRLIIEQGGSHAFDGFENHVDRILSFCGLIDNTGDS